MQVQTLRLRRSLVKSATVFLLMGVAALVGWYGLVWGSNASVLLVSVSCLVAFALALGVNPPDPNYSVLIKTELVLIAVLFLSSWIYFAPMSGLIFVTGSQSTGRDGWLIAPPVPGLVKNIPKQYTYNRVVVATTRDNKQVQATITTHFLVDSDPDLVLAAAHRFNNSTGVYQRIDQLVGDSFKSVVSAMTFEELEQKYLTLEDRMSNLSDANLREVAMRWDGGVKITGIHRYKS